MLVEIQLKVILHMLGDKGIHVFAISLMFSKKFSLDDSNFQLEEPNSKHEESISGIPYACLTIVNFYFRNKFGEYLLIIARNRVSADF